MLENDKLEELNIDVEAGNIDSVRGNDRETLDERVARLETENRLKEQEIAHQAEIKRLNFRRRRVAVIKALIVTLPILLSAIPFIWSFAMLIRVSALEQKVDTYKANNKRVIYVASSEATAIASGDEIASYINSGSEENEGGTRVYLTFDDGPSEYTDEILEILDKYNVKATFFVVGTTDESLIPEYKKIVDAGHSIGIHSYSHDYSKLYKSKKSFIQDVEQMSQLIFKETGIRTKLYRFPGGSLNYVSNVDINELISWLDDEGYVYYDWNALSGDAVTETLSVDELVDNVMTSVRKNKTRDAKTIVLMHDHGDKHNMVEALEPLIRQLQKEGYDYDDPITTDVAPVHMVLD